MDDTLARSEQELIEKEMMAQGMASLQSQAAEEEEQRLVELVMKDSVPTPANVNVIKLHQFELFSDMCIGLPDLTFII